MSSKFLAYLASDFLSNFYQTLKKSWSSLILSIFIISCIILSYAVISSLIFYVPIFQNLVNVNNIFSFRFFIALLNNIVIFLISFVFAQMFIIQTLFTPETSVKEKLKQTKKNFIQFFYLSIANSILLILATLPIHAATLLFAMNNLVLGMISIITGLLLVLFMSSYLLFSPFILIEKQTSWLKALKESVNISGKKIARIVFHVIILVSIILILQGYSDLFSLIPISGAFLNTFIFIILTIFGFTYTFSLYKTYK